MGVTVTAGGASVTLDKRGAVIKLPEVAVDGNRAADLIAAWAADPANATGVAAARLQLLGTSPLKGWDEQAAADAARLVEAARRGDVVAHAKGAVPAIPAAVAPTTRAYLVAAVVRDLTGTPLRGVSVDAVWGSESEAATTDERGMARWTPAPSPGEDVVRVTLALRHGVGLQEYRMGARGWRPGAPVSPRALVCTGLEPVAATFWVGLPDGFNKRFAWQDRTLREQFYPYRVLMLRRFVRLHREGVVAQKLTADPGERDAATKQLKETIEALNRGLAGGAPTAEVASLRRRLYDCVIDVAATARSPAHVVSKPATVALLVRFLVNVWVEQRATRTWEHRRAVEEALACFDETPSRYPLWTRYMVLQFSGMVYTSAHGSLGRPDFLIGMLRLGEGGKPKPAPPRKPDAATPAVAAPIPQLHAELAGADSTDLLLLAVEARDLKAQPNGLDVAGNSKLAAAQGSLRLAIDELLLAGPATRISDSGVTPMRALVEQCWQTATPALLDLSPGDVFLQNLLERDPYLSGDDALIPPIPRAAWDKVVAYTPLRATRPSRITSVWTKLFPSYTFPNAEDEVWDTFLASWLGSPAGVLQKRSVTQWREYHAKTLEPIIRGVCNENNEMSYKARGLFLTSGGGLGVNAAAIYHSGTFERVTSAAKDDILARVPVGTSLFSLSWAVPRLDLSMEWNLVKPEMAGVLEEPARIAPVILQPAPPDEKSKPKVIDGVILPVAGASPETLGRKDDSARRVAMPLLEDEAGVGIWYWSHECVVLAVDPVLERVVLHNTAVPTGTHTKAFAALVGLYAGVPAEAPERDAQLASFVDPHVLKRTDDGPDPPAPPPGVQYVAAVAAEDGTLGSPQPPVTATPADAL